MLHSEVIYLTVCSNIDPKIDWNVVKVTAAIIGDLNQQVQDK